MAWLDPDEPSLGLQPSLVRTIIEAIRRINERGITVLLIEQNVHVATDFTTREVAQRRDFVAPSRQRVLMGRAWRPAPKGRAWRPV